MRPVPAASYDKLTSHEVYLRHPPGTVLACREVRDLSGGMYPCYYVRSGNQLQVSSSALSLVSHLGNWEPDAAFTPPDFTRERARKRATFHSFFRQNPTRSGLKKKVSVAAYHGLNIMRRLGGPDLLSPATTYAGPSWYVSDHTLDVRIRRLKPLHAVSDTVTILAHHEKHIRKREDVIRSVVLHLTTYMRDIEAAFPAHQHVIMTGGLDSQLLALVPKRVPENWHIFSSWPNAPLVRQWLSANSISHGRFVETDDLLHETRSETRDKILCSDAYADPRDLRWLPRMRALKRELGGRCLFWGGTAADAFFKYHHVFHDPNQDWMKLHLTRVASYQGTYHQTHFNFVGSPYLSPYHSEAFWRDIVLQLDPAIVMDSESDLRKEIADRLLGRSMIPIRQNPGPRPYAYPRRFSSLATYVGLARSVAYGRRQWSRDPAHGGLGLV